MAYSLEQLGQDPAYERFLIAPVGDDAKGASVSVLSMLSRLGVDPWREAADLAAMPHNKARARLDVLMSRFTDVPSLIAPRGEIISQLLARLPKTTIPRRLPIADVGASEAQTTKVGTWVLWLGGIAIFLGYVTFLANGN